jgi:hypothetical protein
MLESRDEHTKGLPFACLVAKIILQSGIDISAKPKMRHEGQDEAPQPPPVHVELPTGASSSKTAPPSP